MTATDHEAKTTTTAPHVSLEDLKSRFSNVREPILVALHILLQEPSIPLETAKTTAKAYGVRITAASVAAARRLLERMDTEAPAPAVPAATTPATRPARRSRAAEPAQDTDALVRALVVKLQAQGNAESEKLRVSIRKAIDLLTAGLA
jgi:hypothetical protein